MDLTPDYVVVGHVTRDVLSDGGYHLGGTASYAAITAARLGLQVGVLTSCEPGYLGSGIGPSIAVRCQETTVTTTFENVYTSGSRRQYLRGVAARLTCDHVPEAWLRAPLVHLGPVAQEVDPAMACCFPDSLLGVTPQGWLRCGGADGTVGRCQWTDAEKVLSLSTVTILSPEDLGGDRSLLRQYLRWSRLLVLTLGRKGAIVHSRASARRVPAFQAEEVDPTGAGDVFAAAFLISYKETGDCIEAARFGNCAASFAIEGPGATTVATREQIERRLRHGRCYD